MPIDRFKDRMDRLIREIRNSPKARGAERIRLPGEMEWEYHERAVTEGMVLPEDVVDRLAGLAEDIGLNMQDFF